MYKCIHVERNLYNRCALVSQIRGHTCRICNQVCTTFYTQIFQSTERKNSRLPKREQCTDVEIIATYQDSLLCNACSSPPSSIIAKIADKRVTARAVLAHNVQVEIAKAQSACDSKNWEQKPSKRSQKFSNQDLDDEAVGSRFFLRWTIFQNLTNIFPVRSLSSDSSMPSTQTTTAGPNVRASLLHVTHTNFLGIYIHTLCVAACHLLPGPRIIFLPCATEMTPSLTTSNHPH